VIETETKFRLASRAEIDRLSSLLAEISGVTSSYRAETDLFLDTMDHRLTQRGCQLRVRSIDGTPGGTVTFKGAPTFVGAAKVRTEIEIVVSDEIAMQRFFEALDYSVLLRYRKARRTWMLGVAEVALDELDVGFFCEIEGPPTQIAEIADRLGLSETQVEIASYPELVLRSSLAPM